MISVGITSKSSLAQFASRSETARAFPPQAQNTARANWPIFQLETKFAKHTHTLTWWSFYSGKIYVLLALHPPFPPQILERRRKKERKKKKRGKLSGLRNTSCPQDEAAIHDVDRRKKDRESCSGKEIFDRYPTYLFDWRGKVYPREPPLHVGEFKSNATPLRKMLPDRAFHNYTVNHLRILCSSESPIHGF